VVEFVAGEGQFSETDDRAVTLRSRVDVDDRDRVWCVWRAGEGRDVGELLWRCGGSVAWGGIEGRVGLPQSHEMSFAFVPAAR